jgi:hypothetical protein
MAGCTVYRVRVAEELKTKRLTTRTSYPEMQRKARRSLLYCTVTYYSELYLTVVYRTVVYCTEVYVTALNILVFLIRFDLVVVRHHYAQSMCALVCVCVKWKVLDAVQLC